jgi:DNA-binding CsgD family transcriptional regulator
VSPNRLQIRLERSAGNTAKREAAGHVVARQAKHKLFVTRHRGHRFLIGFECYSRFEANSLTARQISTELGIGHNTVRTHVQNVIAKLRGHSRIEAVALALREKLV